jgi:hypothetical protein
MKRRAFDCELSKGPHSTLSSFVGDSPACATRELSASIITPFYPETAVHKAGVCVATSGTAPPEVQTPPDGLWEIGPVKSLAPRTIKTEKRASGKRRYAALK